MTWMHYKSFAEQNFLFFNQLGGSSTWTDITNWLIVYYGVHTCFTRTIHKAEKLFVEMPNDETV